MKGIDNLAVGAQLFGCRVWDPASKLMLGSLRGYKCKHLPSLP